MGAGRLERREAVDVGRGSHESVVLGAYLHQLRWRPAYPPTFDNQGNLYLGVANPAPFPGTAKYPWARAAPARSLHRLDRQAQPAGKLLWFYQLTPHDIYDWDMQNSPILATEGGQQLVIDGGKAGILVASTPRPES